MARSILDIGQAVLLKNQGLADVLRKDFQEAGVFVVNVVSSPGSGKTELLAKTLDRIAPEIRTGVIVGDLATDRDAARMAGRGAAVLQITTDGYCHLEANMVREAVSQLGIEGLQLLIIENVGNLVCPSTHDLGEDLRVVLLSVTEGEDKPLKYPGIFKSSQMAVVTKTDIGDAVGWDRDTALQNIRDVAPQIELLETSARTGQGLDEWIEALRRRIANRSAAVAPR